MGDCACLHANMDHAVQLKARIIIIGMVIAYGVF